MIVSTRLGSVFGVALLAGCGLATEPTPSMSGAGSGSTSEDPTRASSAAGDMGSPAATGSTSSTTRGPDEGATSTGVTAGDGEVPASGGESSTGSAPGPSASTSTGGSPSGPTPPDPTVPVTLWIAGDSTVANGSTPCPRGWGREFAPLFNENVTVRNLAAGGRSVRTWLYEVQATTEPNGECAINRDASGAPVLQDRWQTVLDEMVAGDYLFIQFGINDGDPACDRHVGVTQYGIEISMMAQTALDRGAHPIFLTPANLIRCSGATAVAGRGFLDVTRSSGEALNVPFIDLHQRSTALYNELGFCPLPDGQGDVGADTPGEVGAFFCDDHTHFDTPGAQAIASIVGRALEEQGIELAAYLVASDVP